MRLAREHDASIEGGSKGGGEGGKEGGGDGGGEGGGDGDGEDGGEGGGEGGRVSAPDPSGPLNSTIFDSALAAGRWYLPAEWLGYCCAAAKGLAAPCGSMGPLRARRDGAGAKLEIDSSAKEVPLNTASSSSWVNASSGPTASSRCCASNW